MTHQDTLPGKQDSTTQRSGEDEEACSKMWNTYIEEAQRYDQALLLGWKEDMGGMLIFSALYSASLTAFLIESYKNLQENPAASTVVLLARISQQLASASTSSDIQVSHSDPLPTFRPPAAALACNILWFLSLALALTCSLLATFVQQWTRDFIHKTTMRPSPARRARILAFLYFGLRDFGMHTLVDIIPILLHISLLFFFVGLVGFLSAVNQSLTIIMSCIVLLLLVSYIALTCLPVLYLHSPYRTPLSSALWRRGSSFHRWLLRKHSMEDYPNLNLTEAMLQKSQHSPEERDIRAVKFTMSSLTDDTDLLPLLEAVPDLIYSPIGLRSANISLVDPLLASSSTQLNIIPRINSFMARSGAWTASQLHTLSMTICPKALWALAYLFLQNQRRIWKQSTNPDNIETFLFDRNVVEVLSTSQFLQKDFACSALAAVRLVRGFGYFFVATKAMRAPFFSDDQGLLKRLEVVLRVWKDIDLPGASGLASLLDSVGDVMEVLRNDNVNPDDSVNQSIRNLLEDRAFPILERRWKANQIAILSEFLVNCLATDTYPNQFPLLYNIVFPDGHPSSSSITAFQDDEVDSVYKPIRLIQSTIITTGRYSPITDEVAKCSLRLFFLIPQAQSNNQQPIEFRKVIQTYIIARGDSDRVALKDLWEKDQYSCLGNCILHDILHNQFLDTEHVDICIIAMWQLCRTALHTQSRNHIPEIAHKFAKDLFPALRNAHEKIQQHKLYTTIKLFIDWIVLNNVGVFVGHVVDGDHLVFRQDRILRGQVPDDQVMDNIYTLGREMLPDLFSPEFKISRTPFTYARGLPGDKDLSRSLQEMNHMSSTFQPFRSYFMSVNLILVARLVAIIARDSDLDEEHNVRLLERLILDFRFYGSSANEESQVRFADSLLDLAFTFVEKPGVNLPSSVLKIIFNKTNTSFSWKWISSRRCAQILLESIQKLEDSGNSADIGMCQEDFDPILDICWEVIDDSGQIRNIARMAETVSLDSEISTESSEVTEVESECVKVIDRG